MLMRLPLALLNVLTVSSFTVCVPGTPFTGASLTAVRLTVVVAATLLFCVPSFTVHVIVRESETVPPTFVGLSLVELNATVRSRL